MLGKVGINLVVKFSENAVVTFCRRIKAFEIFLFVKTLDGKTGVPYVDANMRELACTGFMSNRGRQVW